MQSHSTLKSCSEILSVISKIKSTRELYNEAILNRDVEAICSFLTFDYHVITGRGVQSHGIDEQRLRWQEAFSQDPVMLYRRRTKKVHARSVLQYAEELGTWAGKYKAEHKNVALVAGVYTAKWQKQNNGLWLIQAEVFTTLHALSWT